MRGVTSRENLLKAFKHEHMVPSRTQKSCHEVPQLQQHTNKTETANKYSKTAAKHWVALTGPSAAAAPLKEKMDHGRKTVRLSFHEIIKAHCPGTDLLSSRQINLT